MHRKSLEAAEHLKDDGCNNSDHEETTSLRTDTSDTSVTSGTPGQQPSASSGPNPNQGTANPQQQNQLPLNSPHQSPQGVDKGGEPPQNIPNHRYEPSLRPDDPEVFRNNSIACLRAKAQEHSAKLLNHGLNHGLMLQVRSLANMTHAQSNCDANANNLNMHHSDIVSSDTSSSMF